MLHFDFLFLTAIHLGVEYFNICGGHHYQKGCTGLHGPSCCNLMLLSQTFMFPFFILVTFH